MSGATHRNRAALALVAKTPETRLAQLTAELHGEVEAVDAALRDAVGHAVRVGELLTEIKPMVGHGNWLPWLADNFPGSVSTANNYMRLAAHSDQLAICTTVRQALDAVSKSTPTTHRRSDVADLWHRLAHAIETRPPLRSGQGPSPYADADEWAEMLGALSQLERRVLQLPRYPAFPGASAAFANTQFRDWVHTSASGAPARLTALADRLRELTALVDEEESRRPLVDEEESRRPQQRLRPEDPPPKEDP